jgi:hypothetical protein
MDLQDIDEINELLKVKDMDLDLADDIDDYVRNAPGTPEETKLLVETLEPYRHTLYYYSELFYDNEETLLILDGHDLMRRLWDKSLRYWDKADLADPKKSQDIKEQTQYYNQVLNVLLMKFNKLPTMIGTHNKLAAAVVKWRIKIRK